MRIDLTKRITPEELAMPVGALLTEFEYVFRQEMRIEDILYDLQAKTIHRHIEFFYIVDEDGFLLGLISMKDLIYHTSNTQITEIIERDIIKLHKNDPLEKALKILSKYRILVIPIVDEQNKFLGVLEILPEETDLSYRSQRVKEKNLKEDLFQFIGFSIEQGKWTSCWQAFRYRMPWLACNLVGGLICALIGEVFQFTLVEFVVLALFIPLILTLSESVSIQAMTLSLRFIHLRKIYWSQIWRRILSEWKTSALLGIASSIVISGFYFAWSADLKPVLAISGSLIISMVASATFGALFPILLHLLHLDPKVAAGPVTLMMADIVTITIYLSLSTAFLL